MHACLSRLHVRAPIQSRNVVHVHIIVNAHVELVALKLFAQDNQSWVGAEVLHMLGVRSRVFVYDVEADLVKRMLRRVGFYVVCAIPHRKRIALACILVSFALCFHPSVGHDASM